MPRFCFSVGEGCSTLKAKRPGYYSNLYRGPRTINSLRHISIKSNGLYQILLITVFNFLSCCWTIYWACCSFVYTVVLVNSLDKHPQFQ